MFEFNHVWALVALVIGLCLLLITLATPSRRPSFAVWSAKDFLLARRSVRELVAFLPPLLLTGAIVLSLVALADPVLLVPSEETSTSPPVMEGHALYLVVDRSGSMETHIGGKRRIDIVKGLAKRFIESREGDLVGLVAFARLPEVLSPLTRDREALLEELDKLEPVPTREMEGTAIGYAIFKTSHMIGATKRLAREEKIPYEIRDAAVVVLTDGLQGENPLDHDHPLRSMGVVEAASYAQKEGLKLYIIDVEPKIRYPQYAEPRRALEKGAELTGGHFYIADDEKMLGAIFAEIDSLECSRIPLGSPPLTHFEYLHLRDYLIAAALACVGGALLLGATYLRRAW